MKNEKVRSISELKSQRLSVGILASRWIDFKQNLEILAQHQLHLLHFDRGDRCKTFFCALYQRRAFNGQESVFDGS